MQTLQTTLAAGAAVAALLGILFALLSRRWTSRTAETASWPVLAAYAALGAVALSLLTLPSREPFSPGNTLGWGFLAGAALGLLALYLSATGAEESALPDAVGLLSAAALGPAALLYLFRGDPSAALGGCALGAVFVACLGRSLTPLRAVPTGDLLASPRLPLIGLEPFALAAATLFAAARLGMEHFPRNAPNDPAGGYWAAPALLLMAGALALCLMPGRGRNPAWLSLLYGGITGLFVAGGAALLWNRVLPDLAWTPPLYGLLGFAFLLFMLLPEPAPADPPVDSRPVTLALGAVFLTLVVLALAFQRQQAYGQTLALLPAALLVAVVRLSGGGMGLAGPLGVGAWTFGLLLTLYRVFVEEVGRGRPLDFQNHYDVVALLLGLGGTFALLGYASADADSPDSTPAPHRRLPRTLLLGFGVAAAPLAIATAWGLRAAGAYLIGLPFAVVAWMLLAAWSVGRDRLTVLAAAPHLFAVASALIAIQLTPFVLDLELTRIQRIGIIGALALVALVVIFAVSARRSAPKELPHETPA